MASKAAIRPLAQLSASLGLKQTAQRGFATTQRTTTPFQQPVRAGKSAHTTTRINRQELRRGFADKLPDKQQVKKKSWRFLKWTWRITYLSLAGTLVYTAYNIYIDRNPPEQAEADPKKKTLVVLGKTEA